MLKKPHLYDSFPFYVSSSIDDAFKSFQTLSGPEKIQKLVESVCNLVAATCTNVDYYVSMHKNARGEMGIDIKMQQGGAVEIVAIHLDYNIQRKGPMGEIQCGDTIIEIDGSVVFGLPFEEVGWMNTHFTDRHILMCNIHIFYCC